MNDRAQSETLADQVYQSVLDLLYQRDLTGAESLSPAGLAESLGVSRTPVNIALARLEGEGLICKTGGKGFILAPLGLEDIKEIFELKMALEPLTARLAAERATRETGLALLAIVEEMEDASQAQDLDAWLDADLRFHKHLFRLARNSRLTQFQSQLNHQLYRFWVGYSSMEGHMVESCVEHRLVAEAVAAGDADRAAQTARNHVHSLRNSLLDVVKNVLIPFLGDEM